MTGRDDQGDGADGRAVAPSAAESRPEDRTDAADSPAAVRRGRPEDESTAWTTVLYDVGSSVLAVALIAGFLFAVSGVWPPMVAIESGSMHPNMQENDLVFVMDEERFPGPGAHDDTGVVPTSAGEATDYTRFGQSGDVIVFAPDGDDDATPIIHRAMFWVNESENWYEKADPNALSGASDCEELQNCPAPNAGFVTKGDANSRYDQVGYGPMTDPVRPEWIVGTAEVRVPRLGWIRLQWF